MYFYLMVYLKHQDKNNAVYCHTLASKDYSFMVGSHIDYRHCSSHNVALARQGNDFWHAQLAAAQFGSPV